MNDNRKLYECDPSELDFPLLINLQASLIAKMILTNKELLNRYEQVLQHDGSVPGSEKIDKKMIQSTSERLEKITTVLEFELSQLTQNWKIANNEP